MPMNNSKNVGLLGEEIAIVELLENDIIISRPLGDNSRYDLIIDINNKLYKTQIKSTMSSNDEAVKFNLRSSYAHRRNNSYKKYTIEEIDLFLLVDITKKMCFLLSGKHFIDKTHINIRYKNTKNKQYNNINWYSDFLLVNIIDELQKK